MQKYKEQADALAGRESELRELQQQREAEGATLQHNMQRRMEEMLGRVEEANTAQRLAEERALQTSAALDEANRKIQELSRNMEDMKKQQVDVAIPSHPPPPIPPTDSSPGLASRLEAVLARIREARLSEQKEDEDDDDGNEEEEEEEDEQDDQGGGGGGNNEGSSSEGSVRRLRSDSGVEDSSDTTGQSDSNDNDDDDEEDSVAGAPAAPQRPSWMEEAATAQEAHQKRLSALSPRTQRKQQLQGMLRRGAVFNKEKDDEAPTVDVSKSPSSSPAIGRRKSGGLILSGAAHSPVTAVLQQQQQQQQQPQTPPAPLASPKKKKGHLELNHIIAALTPKHRRKEDVSASPPPADKPAHNPTSPRMGRMGRSSTSSGFLRKKQPTSPELHQSQLQQPQSFSSSGSQLPLQDKRPNLEGMLVDTLTHEFRVLEISVFQAINLEDLGSKSVRVETSASALWRFVSKKSPVTDEGTATFADELRIVGDKRALATRKNQQPLMAQLVSTDAKGRDDLVGVVEIPIHEAEWNDATWTSMRWLPVLGMLQEVRGLVQVIMRRTTVFSERSFVTAVPPTTSSIKLPCHQMASSCKQSYRLPEEGDPPEVSSVLLVTPLEQAIENRDVDSVAKILESGAQFEPDWRNSAKQTVLHLMACAGKASLCRLVLTLGARVGLSDRDGNTPLHLACHFGHVS